MNIKLSIILTISFILSTCILSVMAQAHGGRTDVLGGHYDLGDASGLGVYHFHCGGKAAHLHDNGQCPYGFSQNVEANKIIFQPEKIKTMQQKLNAKGYDCGEPDGFLNDKTMDAIKKYQNDCDLEPTGVPDTITQRRILE